MLSALDLCEGFGESRHLAFDLQVAVLFHAADKVIDHGLAIIALVGSAAGCTIGRQHFISTTDRIDIQ